MTRILKSFGLAMAAMAALVAVMAPAASAEPGTLTAPQYPAFVTSQQQGGGATFDIGAGAAVGCAVSRLDATIGQAANPVTFRPTYANCIAQPGGLPATVITNGCDYRFGFTRPGTTGLGEGTGTMQAALVCPDGQQIEIHVYANAGAHEENVSMCTYDVLPQPPVPAGVYHNSTMMMPKDVLATVKASFTADSTINAGMGCGGNPMMNGHLPVTLTGSYTMQGFEDIMGVEGAQIDLDVG